MTGEADFEASDALGAPEAIAKSPFVVMKFGGTSVSSLESWQTIETLIRSRLQAGLKPVVVHSALSGISNLLSQALDEAMHGDPGTVLQTIRDRHLSLAADLGIDGPELVDEALHELEQLVAGVRLVREVSVRVRVRVMALGELMSTRMGAAWLRSRGLDV
ncbi:MAG: hypothetical protein R3358_10370, partial [Woeseiaceae bacterium]|nr:hypothetical protein [Woeseiaceae bacterium]